MRKVLGFLLGSSLVLAAAAVAQLVDRTVAPNAAGAGISKSLAEQIGAGRGDWFTPDSSSFIIARDPFRAIRRGRQLFQRKFTRAQGQGPLVGDGAGDIHRDLAIGAGLADSCAACHGRPRGSAGAGGDVVTRPDSRDAPHLFGLGLKEMLADEMTADLRAIRADGHRRRGRRGRDVARALGSKGISYGIDHRPCRRVGGHLAGRGRRHRPARAPVLRPRRARSPSASSWWGPGTRRWACSRSIPSWRRPPPGAAS